MPQEDLVLSGALLKYCSFPCLRRWQKRLFFLTPHSLMSTHEDGKGRKNYSLTALIDIQMKDSIPHSLEFRVVFEGCNLRLRAPSSSQKATWLQALRPKRRYTETHRPSYAVGLELGEFLKSEPERLLGSAVTRVTRKRMCEAWVVLRQCSAQ